MTLFYGKYRGSIENNVDPMLQGRVQVSVPEVLGDGRLSWAEPCVPYAGSGVGLLTPPPIGALVWVEFEGGDTDYPILAGCRWGIGELPGTGLPQEKIFQTDSVSVTVSDLPGAGGVTIEVGAPAVAIPMKLVLDSGGIELSMGSASVKLTAASVSLNDGALEVT